MNNQNLVITRKFGMEHNLYRLLEKCAKDSTSKALAPNFDMLFSQVSILHIMSELLDIAIMPSNPYKIKYLEDVFSSYSKRVGALLFELEDLFKEGWLIKSIDEWCFTASRVKYDRLNRIGRDRESQILNFIKELLHFPYRDTICVQIEVESENFKTFIAKNGIDIQWLINKDIIRIIDDKCYIWQYSNVWKEYGSIVLSEKLNVWLQNDNHNAYDYWFEMCGYLSKCWQPEINVTNMLGLYSKCLDYLEYDKGSWEQETIFLHKWKQLEIQKLSYKDHSKLPIDYSESVSYYEGKFQHRYELESFDLKVYRLFYICMRNYNRIDKALQQRFRNLLKRPLYNILHFHFNNFNDRCTIDCLGDEELFLDAIVSLQFKIKSALLDKTIGISDVQDFSKNIWDIFFNGIILEKKNEWIENLASWLICVYREACINREQLIFEPNRNIDLFTPLVEVCTKDIFVYSEMGQKIFEHIAGRIKVCKNQHCSDYLGILTRLICCHHDEEAEYTQTLYNIVFDGFIAWDKNAYDRDILLSTLSWSFFDEKIWCSIFKNNCKRNGEFLDLIEHSRNALITSGGNKTSAILDEGNLATIHLYLCTIWLYNLRDYISPEEHKKMERTWIEAFFEYQKAFSIFSGENIRLINSSGALRKCMKYVSYLTAVNKKYFELQIAELNSVDVAFWIEYIDDVNIRNACIDIISSAKEEQLVEKIAFIPTMQQLADKLFNLCFEINDEKQSSRVKLTNALEYVVECVCETVSCKTQQMQDEYRSWIETAKCRLMLLKGDSQKILAGTNDFYKGIVYLNSDNVDDIRKAKEIFHQFYQDRDILGTINYMITISNLIEKLLDRNEDCSTEVMCFQNVVKFLIEANAFKNIYEKYLYYPLKVFSEMRCVDKFWEVHNITPKHVRTTMHCAKIIITEYVKEDKSDIAEELLKNLESRYGLNDDVCMLRSLVGSKSLKNIKVSYNLKPVNYYDCDALDIRSALDRLNSIENTELANVFISPKASTEALSKFETATLNGKVVVHLLKMLFDSVNKLEEYSYDFLNDKRILEEDTYNRALMRIFNLSTYGIGGYQMRDQSQGGTTGRVHRNGENGIGRRDLILSRKAHDIMLLEGIRLSSINTSTILSHLKKMKKYNSPKVSLMAFPIYTDSPRPGEMWKRYKEYLLDLQKKGECGIVESSDRFDWESVGIENPARMVYRTIHYYQDDDLKVTIYHVLIDVGHASDIFE